MEGNTNTNANVNIPHSQDAERAVLGAMLSGEELFAKVTEKISVEDFYLPQHRTAYSAMLELYGKGSPVDEKTLIIQLDATGKLADAGGLTYVTDHRSSLPTIANADFYIASVVEFSTLRKLVAAGQEITREAGSGENDLQAVLADAEKQVFDISTQRVEGGLRKLDEYVSKSYIQLASATASNGITGLPTGFFDLDMKLSGLQRSDLIIIAARPAMGKTSFAMNIAQYAGTHQNAVVAVFELEMSREQLATRMLCTQARVDMQRVKNTQLTDDDWEKLFLALDPLTHSRIYIDDTPGLSVSLIRSKLKRMMLQTGGLDLVVIDYLQLMTYDGKSENRTLAVADMTRTLKILARDLNVPIILLSQLSRAPEQRSSEQRRPVMSDLRESGAIEQDADIILMLYREKVYDENASDEAEVIVAKHRNGPTGTVKLMWRGEYTCFDNIYNGAE